MKALREMDIDVSNCVSQCYDGASIMSGCNTGVRTRITDVNPAAIYIHCHAHQLNLVLVDSCKKLNHAFDFFSLLESVYIYIFLHLFLILSSSINRESSFLAKVINSLN